MHSIAPLLDALPLSRTFTVDDAVIVAALAHHGQRDKGNPSLPYLTHPMRLLSRFDDELHQMVAVLHDAVEDSDGRVTVDLLRRMGAPTVVADAVEALTHRPDEPRAEYLTRVKADPHALAVKLVDNADNSDEARLALLEPSVASATGPSTRPTAGACSIPEGTAEHRRWPGVTVRPYPYPAIELIPERPRDLARRRRSNRPPARCSRQVR